MKDFLNNFFYKLQFVRYVDQIIVKNYKQYFIKQIKSIFSSKKFYLKQSSAWSCEKWIWCQSLKN